MVIGRIIVPMLRLSQKIVDLPIMSLRTGGKVGVNGQPIINPDNLKIDGWYCKDIFRDEILILPTSEVREIIPQGIAVNDHEAMTEPEDLVRLKDVIEIEFELIGKKVITNHKRKVGKVVDYAIDSETFKVQKLYVSRPVYRSLTEGQLTIDRSQIVEIDNRRIIVKDVDIKIESGNQVTTPATA